MAQHGAYGYRCNVVGCPVTGATTYLEKHQKEPHVKCPDCGGAFVKLGVHQAQCSRRVNELVKEVTCVVKEASKAAPHDIAATRKEVLRSLMERWT